MSTQNQTEILVRLKLVIDKKRKKILYAEAGKTFFDYIFAILRLDVVKLLSTGQGSPMVSSLGSLYRSLEALNITFYNKKLMEPDLPTPITQSQILRPLQTVPDSEPRNCYTCYNSTNCCYSFSATYRTVCPKCHSKMATSLAYVYGASEVSPIVGYFLLGEETVTYMVMDDLTVKPLPSSSISILTIFDELKVENVWNLGEEIMDLNVKDGLNLLRTSLQSSTVLNDLFLSSINFPQSSGNKDVHGC